MVIGYLGKSTRCFHIVIPKTKFLIKYFSSSLINNQLNSNRLNDSLIKNYKNLVDSNLLRKDEYQFKIIQQLNIFYNQVLNYEIKPKKSPGFLRSLFFKNKQLQDELPKIKGIYLYGGVGCGKTMMMDMVFGLMPETKLKQRIHFNKFMLSVHDRIYKIKNSQNKNPNQDDFDILAQEVLSEVNVIFFDEFQVTDIADAMLMSRLFTALFNNGLILFCTSNREPNELYKNGLQRDLFLPFIDILEKYCDIICLDSPTDYRKESKMSLKRIYFHSDSETHLINKLVSELINEQDGLPISENLDNLNKLKRSTIEVLGRNIVLEKSYKRLLETDFSFLCKEARGARDYIEFCRLFDVIILRDIPIIDINDPNSLRRFIVFIDTVYDNKIKLVCSGKASTIFTLFDFSAFKKNKVKPNTKQNAKEEISSYSGLEEEIFAVDRTISRLIEMQSETYNNSTKK